MDFIKNLLTVSKNLRIIIICNTFYIARKYFKQLENHPQLERLNKQTSGWTGYFSNGCRVSVFPNNDMALCGVRGDVVVTDLNDSSEEFRTRVLPMLTAPIKANEWDCQLKKFVLNPETEEIIC